MKWVNFTLGSLIVLAAGVLVAIKFGDFEVRRLNARVDELEQEKARLVEYAKRLSASQRVAQVDVVKQRVDEHGRTVNTLLWQEIAANGTLGKPIAVEAIGKQVYFEALVIKFTHAHVGEGDKERGTSLAMFRRIFGDQQSSESVPELGREARPPLSEPDSSPSKPEPPLQIELWKRFWDLVDDPKLAAQYGVRVAQCEAPSVPVKSGQIWEVSLDVAGGINLRKISQADRPGESSP